MGEIPLYFYVPMFPWKDFLMGWIKKIQKHKEERDKLGKFKKTRRKEWREKRDFYIRGGSHTRVFSIGQERPQHTALMWPSLRKTHSYGNLSYNIIFMIHLYFVGKGEKKFKKYMDKKLSHFQVYGYCRVVVNVLKHTLFTIVHEQYIPCITTIYMEKGTCMEIVVIRVPFSM